MKEVLAAVRALKKKSETLLKVAAVLMQLDGLTRGKHKRRRQRRHISNAGRARIRAAQRKRWAAFRKAKKAA